jgi:phenylalanyl-tRNA synthetase beta chain
MEPGESAKVFLADEFLGVLGRLHADLRRTFELRSSPALLELDLDMLVARGLARCSMRPLPRVPGVRRDVALVVGEAVSWAQVAAAVAEVPCELRESVEFLNVYRGRQTGPGRKSVAFAVNYRSPDRTLTDDEVNAVHSGLVEHLTKRLGGALRT